MFYAYVIQNDKGYGILEARGTYGNAESTTKVGQHGQR